MQYVLTEEEYKALHASNDAERKQWAISMQRLCTMVADHMPAGVEWIGKEKPWGCILTQDHGEWYCDDCPVKNDCPYENKQWSE